MTLNDKCTIQRALGLIEGAIWDVNDGCAGAIASAVDIIDEIINKEELTDA